MANNWEDETRRSREQHDKPADSWSLNLDGLRIYVGVHIHYPGQWAYSARGCGLNVDTTPLPGNVPLGRDGLARIRALEEVHGKLRGLADRVREALEDERP